MQNRLSGSVAVVTAAGQGLGEEIARTLARSGAFVVVSDINAATAGEVAASIEAAGGSAVAVAADVTRASEVEALFDQAKSARNRIDILVNAAGGFHRFAPITDISEDEWDKVITLNLKSAFLCARAAAPTMMEQGSGRIINIASQGAIGPNPYAPSYIPYGAAKAALVAFGKHLAKDLGPHGITVNSVSPGTTLTPRVRKVRDEASIQRLIEQSPMRHLVEPQDCAEAVLFLASAESRYVTGINLVVNAGTLIV